MKKFAFTDEDGDVMWIVEAGAENEAWEILAQSSVDYEDEEDETEMKLILENEEQMHRDQFHISNITDISMLRRASKCEISSTKLFK